MAFLPLIPQPTDQLSVSQGNILNNFTILSAIAGNANVGSATINSVAGFNQLNLANQGGTVPSFNGNNGFWSGNFAHDATTTIETWAQYTQGVGGTLGNYTYPISASTLSLTPTAGTAPTNGWSYLASGILIKWGNGTSGTPVNIDSNSGGPAFTKVFAEFVNPFGGAAVSFTSNITAAPTPILSVTTSIALHQFYYFVIGF